MQTNQHAMEIICENHLEGVDSDEDILHYYPLAKTQLAQLAQL
jgi:hypothetical protein